MIIAPRHAADLALFDLTNDVPGHFLRIKRTMIDVSHSLEEAAGQVATPGRLFASFQRFSLFAKEAPRYARLAARCNGIWIFGVADVEPPQIPGVTAVAIPSYSPLANEWFVIADGPDFGMALLTADTNGFAIADTSRRFMGILSSDTTLVRAAATRLSTLLDVPAATWSIDPQRTLHGYDRMTNYLLAITEERRATQAALNV